MSGQLLQESVTLSPSARPEFRPIVVATDGTATSAPAIAMAKLLAARADVHVVSVVEPMPAPIPAAGVPVYAIPTDLERAAQAQVSVEQQARELLGEWAPIVVRIGGRAETVAQLARERQAAVVVTGRRHHGRLGRILHGETPLAIAAAGIPVLVVPEMPDHLPRTAVVAVDLDGAGVKAAAHARPLLREVERVYLVHVRAHEEPSTRSREVWEEWYEGLVQQTFRDVVAALDLPRRTMIRRETISGHPVEELLDYSDSVQADLIISGFRKRLLVDRLTGPRSVAERVFRASRCAMLLVPEPSSELDAGMSRETITFTDPAMWKVQLEALLARNAHRVTSMEIDTLELGTQAQVIGYPLMGVDYDATRNVLHIMLGAGERSEAHLSHSIGDATAIQLYREREGHDLALRVVHGGGYTLLTFRN